MIVKVFNRNKRFEGNIIPHIEFDGGLYIQANALVKALQFLKYSPYKLFSYIRVGSTAYVSLEEAAAYVARRVDDQKYEAFKRNTEWVLYRLRRIAMGYTDDVFGENSFERFRDHTDVELPTREELERLKVKTVADLDNSNNESLTTETNQKARNARIEALVVDIEVKLRELRNMLLATG